MLDQKAAFDVVWHDTLFVKLWRLNIVAKLIRTLIPSYSDLSCVTMNGRVSEQFATERSVRQCGVLSTFYYMTYVDDLLKELERTKLLSTKRGNSIYADDISLTALSPFNL